MSGGAPSLYAGAEQRCPVRPWPPRRREEPASAAGRSAWWRLARVRAAVVGGAGE